MSLRLVCRRTGERGVLVVGCGYVLDEGVDVEVEVDM